MSHVSIYSFVFAQVTSLMTSKISITRAMSGSVAMKSGQVTQLVKTSKNVASSTHISLLDMPECSYIFLVFRQHLPRDCRSISCFLKRAFSCCSAASFEHHVTFQYMGHNLLFIMIELFPCDISQGAAIFSKKSV